METTASSQIYDWNRVLTKDRVIFLDSQSKKEALTSLIDALGKSSLISNKEALAEGIFYREELMSTGIGLGIAVPHVRLVSVSAPVMAVGVCRRPLEDYESIDSQPIRFVFMIAAGKDQHAQYLKLLSAISSRMKHDDFRLELLNAGTPEEFHRILIRENE